MKRILILLLIFAFVAPTSAVARDKDGHFIVVIDAGHGGHDSGAVGRRSKEKDITLGVALKVGQQLKKQNPNITVYYTRSTDVFIGLDERANYAIKKHADLFVSIHANATKSRSANGSETFVLGLHRSKDNLEVAMKENSAILLEEDYTKKYEDFDPQSSESYIIFQFIQNKHLDASIRLAQLVQSGLVGSGRNNRGVKQAGFLVLRKAAMPSVLIELGFITNADEENYMRSESGQTTLAKNIASAIVQYEKGVALRSGQITTVKPQKQSIPTEQEGDPQNSSSEVSYRVQVIADTQQLPSNSRIYRDYTGQVKWYKEGKYYKYTIYDTPDLRQAKKYQQQLRKRFKDCFIVGFDATGNKVGSYY